VHPECFVSFIQKAWPRWVETMSNAFSPFPMLSARLNAVEKEISEILPKRSGPLRARTNSPHFENTCLAFPLPSHRQNNQLSFAPIRNNSMLKLFDNVPWRTH